MAGCSGLLVDERGRCLLIGGVVFDDLSFDSLSQLALGVVTIGNSRLDRPNARIALGSASQVIIRASHRRIDFCVHAVNSLRLRGQLVIDVGYSLIHLGNVICRSRQASYRVIYLCLELGKLFLSGNHPTIDCGDFLVKVINPYCQSVRISEDIADVFPVCAGRLRATVSRQGLVQLVSLANNVTLGVSLCCVPQQRINVWLDLRLEILSKLLISSIYGARPIAINQIDAPVKGWSQR
ncbi:hypothetical protein PFL603g_06411 [Pseudomonas fluorescens]|uniref:Uncharacterized protein n=1 Tax=Pseudomonas fluorescens TaxID=294 RepID=A0A120FWA6_PSEFL|nr:hypothetical protein PFL603g_06411 [Pseudomonas fluorescens]